MEKVTISVTLLNDITKYLETKPFNEVARFFAALQQEFQAQQQAPAAPEQPQVPAE
jgi:hypothetical protein